MSLGTNSLNAHKTIEIHHRIMEKLNLDGSKKTNNRGRPAKLNHKLMGEAFALLEKGRSERSTFTQLNIPEYTWNSWKTRGTKANRGLYYEFFQGIMRARNQSIGRLEDALNACAFGKGPENARVDVIKWLLKHRAPDEYSDRSSLKIEQDQPLGQLPVIPVKFLTEDETKEGGDP